MALIKPLRGVTPRIGKNCFLAETAVIIGDVEIGDDCSIWYGGVLRGDVNYIRIGNRVSIQDNAVIHSTYQKTVSLIGDDVTIGHNVCIHGAEIRNGALIGINATILDGVVVGEGAIVAANALVLNNTIIEPGCVYGGVPAKFIKKVDAEMAKQYNQRIARSYLMYAGWYKEGNE
ncbi:MAG TPA: gamma carbonic anhydrase family protein [Tenuifilaceae bacterium]|nr:gamma carbonic anhydrase family protein [Tenuifilaceae bacterium]HPE17558.1 gamma carbonic anhydrase family protein [Tenuifilaceae bacterium]HPJ45980.1 gamma carbonic anhydrase family protein [Tenuifilaceae bacterium]HPQ34324.1 gamma carbonic anhydrase family protein [Tenuifilaceae bacterium]HRX67992.1 gamma carbonic anhydrase family protein [Tenuifilaceae bacterium]